MELVLLEEETRKMISPHSSEDAVRRITSAHYLRVSSPDITLYCALHLGLQSSEL